MINFGVPGQTGVSAPVIPVGLARAESSYFGTSMAGSLAAMSAISASLGAAWLLYRCPRWLYARFGVPKYRYFGGPGTAKAWLKYFDTLGPRWWAAGLVASCVGGVWERNHVPHARQLRRVGGFTHRTPPRKLTWAANTKSMRTNTRLAN